MIAATVSIESYTFSSIFSSKVLLENLLPVWNERLRIYEKILKTYSLGTDSD